MEYSDQEKARMKLEDLVCDQLGLDIPQVEHLTDDQLRAMLKPANDHIVKPAETVKPKASPRTRIVRESVPEFQRIEDAFAVVDGRLFARVRGSTQLFPCGCNVRFGGVQYRAAKVLRYLLTGEWCNVVEKERKKYQAQVRHNGRVISLGYFRTKDEADAAKTFFRKHLTM